MAYVPRTRLFVPDDLGPGARVGLSEPHAHYLKHVLRLGPGAPVALFNGRDGEWAAAIEGFGKGGGAVTVATQLRGQDRPADLWLVFAPIKRARLDFLVEKATELGADVLQPVITERTQVERVNLDRMRANTVEAAEQTERLTVPELREPQPLERVISAWPAGRRLLLCDESGSSPPIGEQLLKEKPGPWAALTGPEGGFAERELDGLRKLPFVCAVGLGPRVLRADTAALAALAVLQALRGDWLRPRG